MTPQQIAAIKHSWGLLQARQDALAQCFYARLFAEHPEVRGYFTDSVESQARKLQRMLEMIVETLDAWDEEAPMLQLSGRLHHSYGVQASDYAKVGDCLQQALRETLAEHADAATLNAWAVAFEALAAPMRAGAAQRD